jgi:hypothetical protein
LHSLLDNPVQISIFCLQEPSRVTSQRGALRHWRLVRLSPQGSAKKPSSSSAAESSS